MKSRARVGSRGAVAWGLLMGLVSALTLSWPGEGRAGIDTKSYPAAICQTAGTNQSLDYWWGRVVNRSSSAPASSYATL